VSHAEAEELCSGAKSVPAPETTVFKSVGLAIEDLPTARLVHDAIVARERREQGVTS
jgi:ornithine cyclodeaminase/alanine dehydrogenase-like protein (mu-crystallin family)